MMNAWGRGTGLPETDNDKNRRFGVEVVFVSAGGNGVHYTNFSPDILDWQFLSDVYVAKADYTSIKISYTYCRNANVAFFDGLSLFREEFGQTYVYDSDNNLASVTDAAKKASKFEYNAKSDLTGITDARRNKASYTYDSVDRLASVSQEVTRDGMKETVQDSYAYADDRLVKITHNGFDYVFGYDGFGNVQKASAAGTQLVRYEYEEKNGNLLKAIYGNGATSVIPTTARTA